MMRKHSMQAEQSTEASAFLKKTYAILMDKKNKEIIEWSPSGESFAILDHERFASEILPFYFKHNNTKSFIRQLNIHGFKKAGSKKGKGRDYYNDNFKRGRPDLLKFIQRISVKHKEETSSQDSQELDVLRQENESLKKKIVDLEQSKDFANGPIGIALLSSPEDSKKMMEALQVIARIKQHRLKKIHLSPKEQEIYVKTQSLLDSLNEFQDSQSHTSEDTDSWKEESLGKRSTLSLEGDIHMSPDFDPVDNLPWFTSEFPEEESFTSREFDFAFSN
jgi:hypothetical protein